MEGGAEAGGVLEQSLKLRGKDVFVFEGGETLGTYVDWDYAVLGIDFFICVE